MRKARVIETGEIIEVSGGDAPADPWYLTEDKAYHEDELDFNIGTDHKEATIFGWIARDSKRASNTLHFHRNEVKRGEFYWENKNPHRPIGESLILLDEVFPDLTWESEPKEVEITIKIKE